MLDMLPPPPSAQHVFPRSEWRSPASPRTCSGCWSAACSLPMWHSTPATRGRNWGGRTPPCCAPSARTSDSCSWGPRPGKDNSVLPAVWPAGAQHLSATGFLVLTNCGGLSAGCCLWLKQGATPVEVRLQGAGGRPPFAAVHLGRRDYR